MFSPALRIALTKTSAPDELEALGKALAKADALERIEAAFESKINASKARRGEGPTRLSKGKRQQLGALAEDEVASRAQQLFVFEEAGSANEIATALRAGLRSDLQFWSGAAKYTHPEDLPVVEEFVNAKRELLGALNDYFKQLATRSRP
jgi:hypothetical protein